MGVLRCVVLSLALAIAAAMANPAEKKFVVTSVGLSVLSIDGGRFIVEIRNNLLLFFC